MAVSENHEVRGSDLKQRKCTCFEYCDSGKGIGKVKGGNEDLSLSGESMTAVFLLTVAMATLHSSTLPLL